MNTNRNYKTLEWVLKKHIDKGVNSLWTWEEDNFTCIFENYSGDSRIYTSHQLLKLLSNDAKR